jgi:hypothetical protein
MLRGVFRNIHEKWYINLILGVVERKGERGGAERGMGWWQEILYGDAEEIMTLHFDIDMALGSIGDHLVFP